MKIVFNDEWLVANVDFLKKFLAYFSLFSSYSLQTPFTQSFFYPQFIKILHTNIGPIFLAPLQPIQFILLWDHCNY